jgi:hypothetical protein
MYPSSQELNVNLSFHWRVLAPKAMPGFVAGCILLGFGEQPETGQIPTISSSGPRSLCEWVITRPALVWQAVLGKRATALHDGLATDGHKTTVHFVLTSDCSFDAIAAAWLSRHLLIHGRFPAFAESLMDYARMVRAGSWTLPPSPQTQPYLGRVRTKVPSVCYAPHTLLSVGRTHDPAKQELFLTTAWEMLDRVSSHYEAAQAKLATGSSAGHRLWFSPPVVPKVTTEDTQSSDPLPWMPGEWVENATLSKELQRWIGIIAENWCTLQDMFLPNRVCRHQSWSALHTFILETHPNLKAVHLVSRPTTMSGPKTIHDIGGVLFLCTPPVVWKEWVRADGHSLTVIPRCESKADDLATVDYRVVGLKNATISIPETELGVSNALRGLGAALEREEVKAQGLTSATVRTDPWYDGRNHRYTIIDGPRAGTQLTLPVILGTLASRFWQQRISHGVHLVLTRTLPDPLESAADTKQAEKCTTTTLDPETLRSLCDQCLSQSSSGSQLRMLLGGSSSTAITGGVTFEIRIERAQPLHDTLEEFLARTAEWTHAASPPEGSSYATGQSTETPRTFVFTSVQIAEPTLDAAEIRRIVMEHAPSGVVEVDRRETNRDFALLSGRAIVGVDLYRNADTLLRTESAERHALAALLHNAWTHEKLSDVREQLRRFVAAPDDVRERTLLSQLRAEDHSLGNNWDIERLQREFLEVEVGRVVPSDHGADVFTCLSTGMARALAQEEHLSEVRTMMRTLADMAQEAGQRDERRREFWPTFAINVVGVGALTELGLFYMQWREVTPWSQPVFIAGVIAWTVLFLRRR